MAELKMPVKAVEIALTGDYAGFVFTIRKNFKSKMLDTIADAGRDFPAAREAIGGIIVGWNFVDEEGKPYPVPVDDPEIMGELPIDMLTTMMEEIVKATVTNPNPSKPN